jgi:hypothetical protein
MCGERNAAGGCFVLKNGLYINFVVPVQVLALASGGTPKYNRLGPPLNWKHPRSIIHTALVLLILSDHSFCFCSTWTRSSFSSRGMKTTS